MGFNTPVVIFLYKRSSNLVSIVNSIRQIKPSKIYVIADGAKPGERDQCIHVRTFLESLIDWPCTLKKNYSDENMGLKLRFSTGISWVFETEEEAIFIEDDCIPDPSFFRYCEDLLKKYKYNKQIFSISGNNFLFDKLQIEDSYYFSRYPLIWGWATWRRAWQGYDPELSSWGDHSAKVWLSSYLVNPISIMYWSLIFNLVKIEKISTWDYQLTYHCFRSQALNIIPSTNLVTNMGADTSATNTNIKSKTIGMKSSSMLFPLQHPSQVLRNDDADRIIEKTTLITPIILISLLIKSFIASIQRASRLR